MLNVRASLKFTAFVMLVIGLGQAGPAEADPRIRFADFFMGETYQPGIGMEPSIKLSPKMLELHGQNVELLGFMDGLLPRDGMFFMVIKEPMAMCPFHTYDFDWAAFAPVFLKKGTNYIPGPIKVTGRLDVGRKRDETGFVSWVRFYDATIIKVEYP
jgi:hypothetical protein